MSSAAITLKDVSVAFPIRGRPGSDSEADPRVVSTGKKAIFKALDKINLSLTAGDRVGIIGHNGAGKTTLLRTMTGVLPPTSGELSITGRPDSLLDLAAGLKPNASGYENIRFIALMRGHSPQAIAQKTASIIEFTGLDPAFLAQPLRTYSSGMRVRLLFSTITAFTPQILLLDEWFGTADREFSDRVKSRIDEILAGAGIVVLATHNFALLQKHCTTGVWLDHGRVRATGPVKEVHQAFLAAAQETSPTGTRSHR